jgi:enamine deaminase RidA (YjgF/YER057c/UK114 family)
MNAAARLADLGLVLPPVPSPAAAYRPWVRDGERVYTAGQLPIIDGALPRTGKLGAGLSTDEGAALAKRAALNLLAAAAEAADGDLDRVGVLKLTVFVACEPHFTEQHLVANGASDLIGEVLGQRGEHARSAVGVPSLPMDSPVEVEAILTLST